MPKLYRENKVSARSSFSNNTIAFTCHPGLNIIVKLSCEKLLAGSSLLLSLELYQYLITISDPEIYKLPSSPTIQPRISVQNNQLGIGSSPLQQKLHISAATYILSQYIPGCSSISLSSRAYSQLLPFRPLTLRSMTVRLVKGVTLLWTSSLMNAVRSTKPVFDLEGKSAVYSLVTNPNCNRNPPRRMEEQDRIFLQAAGQDLQSLWVCSFRRLMLWKHLGMLIEIAAEIPARARGVVYTTRDRTWFALSWSSTTLLTASSVGNYVRDT